MMMEINYLDWNNAIEILNKARETGLFALIIGPKGTGKTTLVRKFASKMNKELYSVNFSLRTRESHLIGSKTLDKGDISFVEGILVRSMRDGSLLYLDELNAAEPDVLLRLDEALDDRKQLVLKEAEGQVINASNNWFVIATINPLSHVGTKELPPQLLSRFPVRLRLDYPPEDVELEIIKQHTTIDNSKTNDVKDAIKLAKSLREAAAMEELYYSPSLRETIAFAKLLNTKLAPKEVAEIVFANVYDQWGEVEYTKVMDMITSIFGN
ncbi:MAG TPA: MoxR family ATPase [Nitrososphaeraceae archaeon]|jgi:nitric oxide reductase NorQ protein|nr:MoxR family ATPase [Nitrososphaeraceae archaeon]